MPSAETVRSTLAKLAVPFLAGLIPSAFMAGKAYGGDRDRVDALERDVNSVKAVYAADHDVLIRLDANVAWMRVALERGDQGELAKALTEVRDELKARGDR